MPSKKETEETQTATTPETAATSEETSMEAQAADSAERAEEKPRKTRKAKGDTAEEHSFVESIIDTVSSAVESVAETVGTVAAKITTAIGIDVDEPTVEKVSGGNRAQRIGVVTSDKMTKTVVVRVDRLIKHPKYRRYVRRKKQFMAHDELGATTGDKVRIVETRPLSARKRWRVIEIVQKAAK